MVCLGNICRSPVAEGVLRYKSNEYNLPIIVDSAGTSDFHIGESPDKRSQENALKHGVDISSLRGRQFCVSDFDDFDLIYCMDSSNYQNVLRLARNENDKKKVDLLLNALNLGSNMSVPDPYYGDGDGFERVFQLIDGACEALIQKIIRD